MLALEWYRHTPLPDAVPEQAPLAGPSELSQRLTAVFDAGQYCDVQFVFGPGREAVCAHRLVLRRNPDLGLEGVEPVQVVVPSAISEDAMRQVLRCHYAEIAGEEVACLGPQRSLMEIRKKLPEEELLQLESVFGPLDASRWAPLRAAVDTRLFTDCSLQLDGGIAVPVHRLLLASPEDGHYFAAALRWPAGQDKKGCSVDMPAGLSQEALMSLLRLRYGSEEVEVSCILEARHFAELFDWPGVRKRCEAHLEQLLANAGDVDAASLLAVVAHAEESASMPPHLKAAALAAAVRQWSKVAEAAEAESSDAAGNLSAARRAELGTLNRVRRRDGHVCGSLEEYLHAAADDLSTWESTLASDAPQAAKKNLENAWRHWHQILFEYGHIFGAAQAEQQRAKVRTRRSMLREERKRKRGEELRIPEGKVWFEATAEWQEVPGNAICPAGLEYRFDMQTGRNYARLSM
eukprot:TRINITY_DN77598_c0_g1_i1.p1 TRINITY_DN77598_c0_g1~~TRINITY_DN77598_c0_g1_i1.p1  ORF type:complete len:481 (-),score=139.32 TRINITY_DN77598_c0_g1_i1:132-1520(-)